jgi:hypothetical protein
MSEILNLFASFVVQAPNGGYINVNPELRPGPSGVLPTARYHVFYADPDHGSCTFVVAQRSGTYWNSENKPPFVSYDFLQWIGKAIDKKVLQRN